MNKQLSQRTLKKGEVITMSKPKDCVIQVDSGRLWITQSNQRDDIFVDAGSACIPTEMGLLVAEAMSNTVISMGCISSGSIRAANDNQGV